MNPENVNMLGKENSDRGEELCGHIIELLVLQSVEFYEQLSEGEESSATRLLGEDLSDEDTSQESEHVSDQDDSSSSHDSNYDKSLPSEILENRLNVNDIEPFCN